MIPTHPTVDEDRRVDVEVWCLTVWFEEIVFLMRRRPHVPERRTGATANPFVAIGLDA
jgi:hypothetical protein